MDYFQLAVDLTRLEAAPTLAKLAVKYAEIQKMKKPKTDFETVVYVTDKEGQEWEIAVGISYDCTYDPGIYSGPFEGSYPASGDMELTSLVVLDDLPEGITTDMVEQAAADDDRITDEAWDDYHSKNSKEARAADRADYYRDEDR